MYFFIKRLGSATICLSFGASDEEHAGNTSRAPHIIFLLADDLGWNDVSFHGSRQIPTPNIDALAANGVVLQRHYSTPVCTPSRSAFFTSRYPPRTELGYGALPTAGKGALPLRFEVLPQWLKRLGYSTHMVGKRKTAHFATCRRLQGLPPEFGPLSPVGMSTTGASTSQMQESDTVRSTSTPSVVYLARVPKPFHGDVFEDVEIIKLPN
ncbi:hypothetical protein HPB49_010576 [Dermacentor silvarum]|uniref:Uncharacterized protein n=1 Tax=Dermacentor silvarum TaxID=543639 RepID=A0ACB8CER4_DERSI|nr:hypothetical protein HPB49_010576 [Dermacentor silvarum]